MKKTLGYILFLFTCVGFAVGQNLPPLNGTVIDSDVQTWNYAAYSAQLINPSGGVPVFTNGTAVPVTLSGGLTSSGAFTGTIPNNDNILPAGTSWQFTICPLATSPCQTLTPFIAHAATNEGNIVSTLITAPRINGANQVYAYNLTELVNVVAGNGYINTVSNTVNLYNGTWIQIGSGGGGGATLPFPCVVYGASGTSGTCATNAQITSLVTNLPNSALTIPPANYLGSWLNSTAYAANSIVNYGGNLFVAIIGSTNAIPTSSPTQWQAFITATTLAGVVQIAPSGSQTVVEPLGYSLFINSLNNVVWAVNGTIENAVANCNGVYPCAIHVSGNLTQSTVGTYSIPVGVYLAIESGGFLTRTGSNVLSFTTNNPLNGARVVAPPVNIGFGTGGGVTGLNGDNANWCGVISDGNPASGGSGTDNAPAFQSCINALLAGNMEVMPGNYLIQSGLIFTTPNTGIACNCGNSAPSRGAGVASLLLKSATTYGIWLSGTSGAYLYGSQIKNINIQRVTIPTGSSVTTSGVYCTFCGGFQIEGVHSKDSLNGMYFNGSGSGGTGYIRGSQEDWGMTVITQTNLAGLTLSGINIDGTSNQNATFIIEDNNITQASQATGFTSTGYYLHGILLSDFYCTRCQANLVSYGAQVIATGTPTGPFDCADIQFLQPIFDAWSVIGLKVSGLSCATTPSIGGLQVLGGYIRSYQTAAGQLNAINISTSNGVQIDHVELANWVSGSLVSATTSYNLSFTNNLIQGNQNYANIFLLSGVTYSVVSGNNIDSTSSVANFNLSSTSINNVISNNVIRVAATCYTGDGTSPYSSNIMFGNSSNTGCPTSLISSIVASSETVTFSTTPTFATYTRSSTITLTASVTSFTLAAGGDGQEKTLCFVQGATPYTVTAPSNVHGFFTIGTTASKTNCQHFTYNVAQSAWLADSPGNMNE